MKIKVNKVNVGLRIKDIRLKKGYELQQFGDLLGTYKANKSSVFGWENGRSLPNKERIKAIAKLGDITVNELLYGSVEEFISENYYMIVEYNRVPEEANYIKETYSASDFIKFYKGFLNDNPALSEKYNINNIDELVSGLFNIVDKMDGMKKLETEFKAYDSMAQKLLENLPITEQLDASTKNKLSGLLADEISKFISNLAFNIRLETDKEYREEHERTKKLLQEYEKNLKDNKNNQ